MCPIRLLSAFILSLSISLCGDEIAYWDFSDLRGNMLMDQAGNANALVHGEHPDFQLRPGVFGQAFYFESGKHYLEVSPDTAPSLVNDFTVYFVIKPFNVGGWRTIMWKGDRNVDPDEINYLLGLKDGRVELKTKDVHGDWIIHTTGGVIRENEWHEVYLHFKDDSVRIIVNGVERTVRVVAGDGEQNGQLLKNSHPLYFGEGTSPLGERAFTFHGLMDELKITSGDRIDLSSDALHRWQSGLMRYEEKLKQFKHEQRKLEEQKKIELEELHGILFEDKALTIRAPFYSVVLPTSERLVKRPEFIEEIIGLGQIAEISAAGNEFEGFQLIVVSNLNYGTDTIKVEISDLSTADGHVLDKTNIEWGWIRSVITEAPAIPVDFTGSIPDIIIEDAETFSVAAGDFTPVYFRVQVPEGTSSGAYEGTIQLIAGDFTETVPVRLQVYDFTLPPKGSLRVAFAFFERFYRDWYELEELLDEDKRYIYKFLLKYRIPPSNIYSREHIHPELKFLEEFGDQINFFTIRNWGNVVLEGEALDTKMSVYADIIEEIEAIGMLDSMYFYGPDEFAGHMNPVRLAAVAQSKEMLSKAWPWLKRMQTSFPIPELRSYFNAWVPLFNFFTNQDNLAVIESLRAEGSEIWWYAADDPGKPMPNFFLDFPVYDARIIMTLSYMYNIDGILYWCINREWMTNMDVRNTWPDAEWRPYIYHMSNQTRKARNGMGNFVYPGPDGVMYPSLRLENLRDGLEDYEYLILLRQLTEQLASEGGDSALIEEAEVHLKIPADVAVSIDDYNADPASLMRFRNEVAQLIERIQLVLD